jgi:hypothetical protein
MERVLAVDLLHLMASEGSYGAQVAAQLDASEVWHAYRDQKHDLFLPAGATSQVQPSTTHNMDRVVLVQRDVPFVHLEPKQGQ